MWNVLLSTRVVVRGFILNVFPMVMLRGTLKWPPMWWKPVLSTMEGTTAVLLWFLPVEREAMVSEGVK